MENKRSVFLILSAVLFLSIFGIAMSLNPATVVPTQQSEVQYRATVCTDVLRADGTEEHIGCSHNLVTNAGLDHIKNQLGQGQASAAFDYIGLCNASAGCSTPVAGDTTLENEYSLAGLSRTQGTYGDLGTGNWSIYTTFTATDDNLLTNKTGLFNNSASDTLLAENTFSLVTLQTNDQVTVNWTIQVTNP